MRESNKLSALKVARLKKPGRFADGLGLYLEVHQTGSRYWVLRYQIAGRARYLGLGPLHSVSLLEARNRAKAARQLILDGKDPIAVKREAIGAAKVAELKTWTFRQAAEQFLTTDAVTRLKSDKHRAQWRSTLETTFPVIGDLPLQSIDTAAVLSMLLPIWRKTPETGSRLRGRIERVFAWAKAHKLYDGENPATRDVLRDALPVKPKTEHHKAMPYADLPAYMAELRGRDSLSALALEFTILTAVRTSETIGARWSEIDLDAAVWVIPASRMKAKREHRVPLSHRAVEILRQLSGQPDISKGGTTRLFPLSNMAMLELLRGTAGNGYTTHGFRSSFSDWARDRTGYSRDVIEMALAHTIKDKSEAAYRRGDAIDKRRRLMAEWSRFCEGSTGAATVTPIRAAH